MLPVSLVENPGFRDYINYLDPSFNIPSRSKIKNTGLPNLKDAVQKTIKDQSNNHLKQADIKRHQNYNIVRKASQKASVCETSIEDELKYYIRFISEYNFECSCPLLIWKINVNRFKELSKLAKKYLGVPASSAAVERMFSIAGHVFHTKRRKMGEILFKTLGFLKLNEDLLVQLFVK